ncbi:glutathione s-transferase n-terminal domain [Holotrichia oblita]|uniref:Glutathione s-transferase n-terminal domain n=1 Tax=Holotrichia oblita TaxID=644536 RepID=A0ACB9TZ56_HOLOL|nr:glutathione s-transferase n-terminal domain [Holotrichia oblita]
MSWTPCIITSKSKKCHLRRKMYESSCSYQGALELKRSPSAGCPLGIKSEEFTTAADWSAYRFCNPSTFEQLKQSVEKAKAALQDRSGFLGAGSAFSDLYSGVSSGGRTQDSLQDSSRLRDTESEIKRCIQGRNMILLIFNLDFPLKRIYFFILYLYIRERYIRALDRVNTTFKKMVAETDFWRVDDAA